MSTIYLPQRTRLHYPYFSCHNSRISYGNLTLEHRLQDLDDEHEADAEDEEGDNEEDGADGDVAQAVNVQQEVALLQGGNLI